LYAFVQDVASSWDQYERVTAPLMHPAPAGLILHVAGPTDEGFRTIELWESAQAWQGFQAERLAPAIAALGGPTRPEPTLRRLRAAHTVIGPAMARADRFRLQTGDALNPSEKRLRPTRGSENR
jgi:hypothetical protein